MRKLTSFIVLLGFLFAFTSPVLANPQADRGALKNDSSSSSTSTTTEKKDIGGGFSLEEAGFKPPKNLPTLGLEESDDPQAVVESVFLRYIINPIFLISGGVAVVVIMYAGFRVITARGEEEGLTAAKNTLIWAFAGLALVMLAYTIVNNVALIIEAIL